MHFRRFSHSERCRFTFPSTSRKRFLAVPLVVESPDKSPECCYLWCRLVCTHFRTLSTGSQVKAQTTEQSASQPASVVGFFFHLSFVVRRIPRDASIKTSPQEESCQKTATSGNTKRPPPRVYVFPTLSSLAVCPRGLPRQSGTKQDNIIILFPTAFFEYSPSRGAFG